MGAVAAVPAAASCVPAGFAGEGFVGRSLWTMIGAGVGLLAGGEFFATTLARLAQRERRALRAKDFVAERALGFVTSGGAAAF